MNKIEKLIKEMCPDGVEYKKLFEIANILKGQQLNKEKFIKDGQYPVYNGGQNNSGFYNKYNQEENSIILNQGGSAGLVSFIKTKFWASAHCFVIKPINENFVNNKFLFYLLKSKYDDILKLIHGTTIPGISIEDVRNLKINIPPIEIQNEIVKILDTFTQLEAELEAELEARDKQYQYYRNKLLDFDNNKKLLKKLFEKDNKEIDNKIVWKCLGDVFEIKNGFTPSKNNSELWENGTIPWFKLDDIRSNGNILYDSKIKVNSKAMINKEPFKENSIIISTTATIGEHALIRCKFICNQQFTILSANNIYEKLMNPKFIFYYFFNISNILKSKTKNINLPIINIKEIKDMLIPIPSLEIQTKIVNILDKLQDYSKDIKTGLPLEIEQRQKQYEYYRNLLLDFKANAQGGALANSYIEFLNSIEQKLLYSIEFRKLDLITNILKGQQLNKEKFIKDGEFPVYNGGKTHSGFYDKYNQEENSIILNQGGSAALVSFIETKFWASAHCFIIKPINENFINNKFLFYLLKSKYDDISKLIRGTTIPGISIEDLKNFEIDIPSIEIQTKIVNILDKLQDYSKDIKTGLPLEIEQRQKQYEYYRNLLLDFKANAQGGALANSYMELLNSIYKELFYSFEYKSLDKICDVKIGEFIHKHFQNNGEKSIYPVFNGGIENTGYYEKYNHHDKVIISARGANAGFVNYVKTKFWAGNSCYVLFINNVELNSKYLYYQLKNKQENLNHIKTSASIPAISKKQVENFIIPIPSLEVQNKIVEILDKLYDYSKNLKDGLPLEIEQRKKQYEYYRNLLLKF